uniref:Uncharacterized protein LOC114344424 n=1 Tax=Diabrotica virgifera virgifera TaxID=50390 RepID=A0A6P7H007_DIAVI
MAETSGGPPPLDKLENQIKKISYNLGEKMESENLTSRGEINTEKPLKKPLQKVSEYSYKDKGPYEVYISSNTDKNIGNYNYLAIAREIFDLQLNSIKKINKKGKNRISVEFITSSEANKFLKNEAVIKKGYDLFIPYKNVTCKGVVRFIDKSFTDEMIVKYSETKIDNCKIIEARRLSTKKKNSNRITTSNQESSLENNAITTKNMEAEYIPTGTISITFSGTTLPKSIYICGIEHRVLPYILPVVQCYNYFISENEGLNEDVLHSLVKSYIKSLQDYFEKYFPADTDVRKIICG